MREEKTAVLLAEDFAISSIILDRTVTISCFLPKNIVVAEPLDLLLINDGQNMEELGLTAILDDLISRGQIEPLVCVAIHTGKERKIEYGTAKCADYLGRGAKAALYTQFIFEELLPFIHSTYNIPSFKEKSFAGFSLGGLSALDIVWNHPDEFSKAGVFSGSFWWRTRGLDARWFTTQHGHRFREWLSASEQRVRDRGRRRERTRGMAYDQGDGDTGRPWRSPGSRVERGLQLRSRPASGGAVPGFAGRVLPFSHQRTIGAGNSR